MLVSLDQNHKHTFLQLITHVEYSGRLSRGPLVLLQ